MLGTLQTGLGILMFGWSGAIFGILVKRTQETLPPGQ